MKRRDFLKSCSLAAGSMAAFGTKGAFSAQTQSDKTPAIQSADANRYNVLFILVDQWRYSAAGHGYCRDKTVRTPNLDCLAQDGVHWQWCYATQPVCTPNRAAIITGKYPHQMNMESNNNRLPQQERCIAQVFTDAGYTCHYIGKWHLDGDGKGFPAGYVKPGWPRRGFTTFEGFNRGHQYWYHNSFMITDDGRDMKTLDLYPPDTYEPAFQADLAINFIKANKHRPFFCMLSWGPPHTPYNAHPSEFAYNPTDIELRPNVPPADADKAKQRISDYYAHCTAMDVQIGRLMETLQAEGVADRTLVVFTSDHGDMLYSHGLEYKSKPEEESCHIPLLMRLPDCVRPGQILTNTIGSVDLMPTILSLCGLKVPDTCFGKDKSPLLRGQSLPEEAVISEYQNLWRMVVKNQCKLIIRNVNGKAAFTELFDLNNDPYEMKNLLDTPAYAAIQTELKADYAAWQQKTNDRFLS